MVFERHPKLRMRSKRRNHRKNKGQSKSKRISVKPKKTKVEDLVAKADQRRWSEIQLRETANRTLRAQFLQLTVWVEEDGMPKIRQLIVRRDLQKNGSWRYKYSLSNEKANQTKRR